MALDTFTPPLIQSPGTKYYPTIKKKKAEFGDSYTQAMPQGSNPVQRKVDLIWDTLLEDQAQAIVDFFEAHVCVPFYYAMRDGVTRRWTCDVFTRTWQTPNQVTATFEQYFGLEM